MLNCALVTVILCAYYGIRNYWQSRESRLVALFYRDSMLYFVVLAGEPNLLSERIQLLTSSNLVMSITNLAAVFTLPVWPFCL